jgi:hypothetical protein
MLTGYYAGFEGDFAKVSPRQIHKKFRFVEIRCANVVKGTHFRDFSGS